MPVEPAQPVVFVDYNTDQFTDPVSGQTIHDDGSDFYFCPGNLTTYSKQRTVNGQWPGRNGSFYSYRIALVNPILGDSYITENGLSAYVIEDGSDLYVTEGS